MGDQSVARPLPTQPDNTDIQASSEIRTHDASVRARENSSCFIATFNNQRKKTSSGIGLLSEVLEKLRNKEKPARTDPSCDLVV
jgi:hypothetical protein